MPTPTHPASPRGTAPAPFATASSRPGPAARSASGRRAREQAPRSAHADWKPPPGRPDPVKILLDQARGRVGELLPLRYGRMLVSPFSFYRGAAAIMASDLASTPTSGLHAQLCGDAHLSNFGSFASPERDLVFDISDFDETLRGPWEWDVKRLAASVCIAGRERDFKRPQISSAVLQTVAAYRQAMHAFARAGDVAVWYARAKVDDIARLVTRGVDVKAYKALQRDLEQGRRSTSVAALGKLTRTVHGSVGFLHKPPLLVPIDELRTGEDCDTAESNARGLLSSYRESLPPDRRMLLDGFGYVTMARKVVGVGSVGMRDWVFLLSGRDTADPLLLQVKEATTSVLERHLDPRPGFANQAERVIEGQRLIQASSDVFLGWLAARGPDEGRRGRRRDYYVRQLADDKGAIDVTVLLAGGLAAYGRLCGWTLARAHARSGDRIAIAGYLGRGDAFDHALAAFAECYADQNAADHEALRAAAASGRVAVAEDPAGG